MRKTLLATLAALAALAAPAPAQDAESYSTRLERLPELQRYAALRSALANSGQVCRRVASAARHGRMRNLAMWVVRCTPAGDYGLFLGPDGSVQVRTCADLATLKLPTCGLPPRPPAAAPAAPPRRR